MQAEFAQLVRESGGEDAAVGGAQLDADIDERRFGTRHDNAAFDDLCFDGGTDRKQRGQCASREEGGLQHEFLVWVTSPLIRANTRTAPAHSARRVGIVIRCRKRGRRLQTKRSTRTWR